MYGDIMKGIEYPILAGFGGFLGCLLLIPMGLLALFVWPALVSWLWVPPVLGIVAGFCSAPFVA